MKPKITSSHTNKSSNLSLKTTFPGATGFVANLSLKRTFAPVPAVPYIKTNPEPFVPVPEPIPAVPFATCGHYQNF
jgi:hypothetical protein